MQPESAITGISSSASRPIVQTLLPSAEAKNGEVEVVASRLLVIILSQLFRLDSHFDIYGRLYFVTIYTVKHIIRFSLKIQLKAD